MKNLVMYYSYSGNTETVALTLAAEIKADTVKIEDVARPSRLKAYVSGAFAARKGAAWPVRPVAVDPAAYDRIFVGGPIWWGRPAPEINAFIDGTNLSGKQVVAFVTMAGSDPAPALKALAARLESRGGSVVSTFSVKTGGRSKDGIIAKAREIAVNYK